MSEHVGGFRAWMARPDVIGAGMGFGATVSALFPPETWMAKVGLAFAFGFYTVAFLLANQRHERAAKKENDIRDERSARMDRRVSAFVKTAAEKSAARVNRAVALSEEMFEFFIAADKRRAALKRFEYPPPSDMTREAAIRAMNDDREAYRIFYDTLTNEFNGLFAGRIISVVTEFADAGIHTDPDLLAACRYGSRFIPMQDYAFRIRALATRDASILSERQGDV
jgi:hypothetical protein